MNRSLYLLLPLLLLGLTSCDLGSGDDDTSLTLETSNERISENPAYYNGFLWKPFSESTGGLVVLTPNPATFGKTEGVATISGEFGTETAPLRHETHNNNRPHFYFSMPGSAYGNNITVQVPLNDGSVFSVVVPNGSQRYEL